MSGFGNIILEQMQGLIEKDQLVLPTLPEVVLKARQVAEDPMVTPAKLARVIEQDPAISVRLMKVVNSPLMRAVSPAVDLKAAISRLGLQFTSNLIVGLAMEQMFQATSGLIERKMRDVWEHSAKVAGKAIVLSRLSGIVPDQAILAGLVHAIGVLPILTFVEENVSGYCDEKVLDQVICKVSPKIGRLILEYWDFVPSFVCIPEEVFSVYRCYGERADCADVILVANLMVDCDLFAPVYRGVDWSKVSAFQRMGLQVVENENALEDSDGLMEEFDEAGDLFKAV